VSPDFWKTLWFGLAGAVLLAGGATWRAMSADRARTRGRSTVFQSRFGAMEYAVMGDGPPVLMIHGTGGGFDQGLDFADPLCARWRIIAPSRFGYLRSAFPDNPSSERQADAFVDLLDELGIGRAAVIGGSAGALSALQFAIRHPSRCNALVALVPAAFAPGQPPVRPPNMLAQAIIEYGLKSDFLFWLGMTLNENAMIAALLATDPALVRNAEQGERARVRAILRNILPVSDRARGLLNDARQTGNPTAMALAAIRAPTLALSLEDDRFATFAAARHIAASVSGARLVVFPTGGHVWVGRNQEVFAEVDRFLSEFTENSKETAPN
jgi:2-hydroxy-6-oxonona-2,4-dienedioate hydrolase